MVFGKNFEYSTKKQTMLLFPLGYFSEIKCYLFFGRFPTGRALQGFAPLRCKHQPTAALTIPNALRHSNKPHDIVQE